VKNRYRSAPLRVLPYLLPPPSPPFPISLHSRMCALFWLAPHLHLQSSALPIWFQVWITTEMNWHEVDRSLVACVDSWNGITARWIFILKGVFPRRGIFVLYNSISKCKIWLFGSIATACRRVWITWVFQNVPSKARNCRQWVNAYRLAPGQMNKCWDRPVISSNDRWV